MAGRRHHDGLEAEQDAEFRRAIQRVMELPPPQMARAVLEIVGTLDDMAVHVEADRRTRLRMESLDCVRRAAVWAEVPEGETLMGKDYVRAVEALGLTRTFRQVRKDWWRWSVAARIVAAAEPPETSRRRDQKKRTTPRAGTIDEIGVVRRWLDETGGGTESEFNTWAAEPDPKSSGDGRRAPASRTLGDNTGVGWARVVAIARGDMTREEARAEALAESRIDLGEHGRLVSRRGAAAILKIKPTTFHYRTKKASFPASAATLHDLRLWFEEDMIALSEERVPPRREPNSLQHLFIETPEFAQRVGRDRGWLIPRLANEWRDIAPPGWELLGGAHVWLRTDIDRFFVEHADVIAALPPTKSRRRA